MMFGPDTELIIGAMQMAAVVAGVTGGAVFLLMRRKRVKTETEAEPKGDAGDLEERVRVLERIATDRSVDLADEIEALRDPNSAKTETPMKEGAA